MTIRFPKARLTLISMLLATMLAPASHAAGFGHISGFGEMEIDTRSRAKIAKEREKLTIQQQQQQQQSGAFGSNSAFGQNESECGSQSIGNVNTNGRPGSAPREVFVFAPNSINVVSSNACK